MKNSSHWIALCLLFLAGPAVSENPAPGPRQWPAEKAGILFEMTRQDLRAWKGKQEGNPIFSVQALLAARKKEFDADSLEQAQELLKDENPPDFPDFTKDESYVIEPLSVVGTIVSYQETTDGFSPGAAHPYHSQGIVARDVSKNSDASLLDFYSESQIVNALKADPWIRKFNASQSEMAKADTLSKLSDLLNEAESKTESDNCEFDAYFDPELVKHFAFYDMSSEGIAVRVGIPYAVEVCRGFFHQVGLMLPIPDQLRDDATLASSLKSGFLMKSRKSIGAREYTGSWEVDIKQLSKKVKAKASAQE